MKKFFWPLFAMLILQSCGGDTNKNTGTSEVSSVETDAVLQNILPSYEEEAAEEVTATTKVEVTQTVENKTKYDIKPAKKSKLSDSLAQAKIKASPNAGKNCEDMIKTFDGLVEQMMSNPTKDVIDQFSKFIADPFHLNCKKIDAKYKEEIGKIEARLDAEDEDEY